MMAASTLLGLGGVTSLVGRYKLSKSDKYKRAYGSVDAMTDMLGSMNDLIEKSKIR